MKSVRKTCTRSEHFLERDGLVEHLNELLFVPLSREEPNFSRLFRSAPLTRLRVFVYSRTEFGWNHVNFNVPFLEYFLEMGLFCIYKDYGGIRMSTIKITFPDGNIKEFEQGITVQEIAKSISNSLAKKALAGKFNGELI